ncbi:MAG: type II secretion system protein [Sedimentibacter sp.]
MKKSKGFTLVEIIVSLAVLGIIAISFLGAISSHFTYLLSTKGITQNIFKAQELMENEIDDAKIRVATSSTLEKTEIFKTDLGGIDVEYESLKISYDNLDYYTLVSNVKPDSLEIISVDSIGVKLMQGTTQVQDDYYGYATDDFSVVGNFTNKSIYKWDHLLNQVEWYISSDEYNIPWPKTTGVEKNDAENHYYPIFPRDYEIFSNETIYKFGTSESTFPHLTEIAGRHLIFTVTPAAKSGKLGDQAVSEPIFISGLPITDNLIMHLDASYIDFLSGTTEAVKVGTDYMLKKWYDIASINGVSVPSESALPTNDASRPIVNRTDVDDEFIGQYVKFDANKYVQIAQGSSGGQVIVYAVLRNRSVDSSKYIVNGTNELTIPGFTEGNENQWNIISSSITLDGTTLKIGDSSVDIAELILYSGSISSESKSKVEEYLNSKYYK